MRIRYHIIDIIGRFVVEPIATRFGFVHVADVCWTLDVVAQSLDWSEYADDPRTGDIVADEASDDTIRYAMRIINPNF